MCLQYKNVHASYITTRSNELKAVERRISSNSSSDSSSESDEPQHIELKPVTSVKKPTIERVDSGRLKAAIEKKISSSSSSSSSSSDEQEPLAMDVQKVKLETERPHKVSIKPIKVERKAVDSSSSSSSSSDSGNYNIRHYFSIRYLMIPINIY